MSPLGGQPVDLWTTLPRCPQGPQEITNSSGHLMCYQTRTSLRAIDSSSGGTCWRRETRICKTWTSVELREMCAPCGLLLGAARAAAFQKCERQKHLFVRRKERRRGKGTSARCSGRKVSPEGNLRATSRGSRTSGSAWQIRFRSRLKGSRCRSRPAREKC